MAAQSNGEERVGTQNDTHAGSDTFGVVNRWMGENGEEAALRVGAQRVGVFLAENVRGGGELREGPRRERVEASSGWGLGAVGKLDGAAGDVLVA